MGPSLRRYLAGVFLLVAWSGRALAADADTASAAEMAGYKQPFRGYDDFGATGLLQVPTARMQPDGTFAIGGSGVDVYDRYFFTLQAMPWLEFNFRYTSVGNRLYGPVSFSGPSEKYKDRSADIKIRLVPEGPHNPEISLAFRDDLGGTSLFSSEYLLASRRYYNWDFTGGVAWGNAAGGGLFTNPLAKLSSHFAARAGANSAGAVSFSEFSGPRVSLVGGVQYQTPIDGLTLMAEYDANNFQNEPLGNAFPVAFPVNFGATYRLWDDLDLSAGYERGNTLELKAVLHTNLNTAMGLPHKDPPPPPMPRPAPLAAAAFPPVPRAKDVAPPLAPVARRGHEVGVTVTKVGLVNGGLRVVLDGKAGVPDFAAAAEVALAAVRADGSLHPGVECDVMAGGRRVAWTRFKADDLVRGEAIAGRAVDGVAVPAGGGWLPRREPLPARPALVGAEPQPRVDGPVPEAAVKATAKKVFAQLARYDLHGYGFSMTRLTATLDVENDGYRKASVAVGRAAEVLADVVPGNVEEFNLRLVEDGMDGSNVSLMRKDVERMRAHHGSPAEVYQNLRVTEAPMKPAPGEVRNPDVLPRLDWGLAPHIREDVGGPTNFFFYQLYADAFATAHIAPGLSLSGAVGQNLTNNMKGLTLASNSVLPHVRSDLVDYLKGSSTWVDDLYLNYQARLAPAFYGKVTAGLLEWMYSGVEGEVLWYPANSRLAVGYDMARVYQRDFNGLFGLRNYSVTTGDLTAYYKLPFYGLQTSVSVGRYLAGDWGGTVTLARTFDNGVTFGVFATKTNVSAQQFGEGSFDKGFTVSIPFDLFSGKDSHAWGSTVLRPLTRDGGQRVAVPEPLYPAVDETNAGNINDGWGEFGR